MIIDCSNLISANRCAYNKIHFQKLRPSASFGRKVILITSFIFGKGKVIFFYMYCMFSQLKRKSI